MRLLGCELFHIDYSNLKHRTSDHEVYFVPDACHNLKLARNAIRTLQQVTSPSGIIDWEHIIGLNRFQNDIDLKLANKVSNVHIHYKANIMKVKYATQTLSNPTADALEFLQFSQVGGFNECHSTIQFIRTIDRIFDFLNS